MVSKAFYLVPGNLIVGIFSLEWDVEETMTSCDSVIYSWFIILFCYGLYICQYL